MEPALAVLITRPQADYQIGAINLKTLVMGFHKTGYIQAYYAELCKSITDASPLLFLCVFASSERLLPMASK